MAQSVRSTIGALGAANQQLGNVQGLLSTTQSGLNDISNTMASMRDVLVKLTDGNVSGNQRTNYVSQYRRCWPTSRRSFRTQATMASR